MFTGIISDIGTVAHIVDRGDRHITLHCHYPMHTMEIGMSVACNGVCLTAIDLGLLPDDPTTTWFKVTVSHETLDRTTIGQWQPGSRINLERSLRIGDELGGHIVTGHVDGLAEILAVEEVGESRLLRFAVPGGLEQYLAEKGSVTLHGISLTVNRVHEAMAEVNIIPHTWEHTTLNQLDVGDMLHLEVDLLARYVSRMLGQRDAV